MARKQSYPLICRGGGAMKVTFVRSRMRWAMLITFKRSAHNGVSGKLKAGEAGWTGRTVNADEPNTLALYSYGHWFPRVMEVGANTQKLKGMHFGGKGKARAQKLYEMAITSKNTFVVHCFNNGKFLEITRVGA